MIRAKTAGIGALALLLIAGSIWTVSDYRSWYALGPAGVPHNFEGWLQVSYWRLFKTNSPFDQSVFAGEIGKPGDVALLKDLPKRDGERPVIDPHPIPHRQITERSDPDIRKYLRERFDAVVARHADVVMWGPSHVENGNDGVLLIHPDPGNPTIQKTRVWGEVGHIHAVDGSLHLVLSPSDTKAVIDTGWGELYRMVGQRAPLTYTLIYAPRTKAEVDVAERMLEAAVAYSSYRGTESAQH
jgi:hypothetical protein